MLTVRKFQVHLIKKYPRLLADPYSPKLHSSPLKKSVDFNEFYRALNTLTHRIVRPCYPREYKKIRVEYKAVCTLLTRSNLTLNSFFKCSYPNRHIHTSSPRSNKSEEDKNKKKDDKKEDDNSSLQSLMFKAALWLMISLILLNVSTAVAPADNNQAEGMRYVSWNEFVYNMLSKGEVQEIIVRPDLELVTIVLYEGAVIKGKKVTRRLYHMNIGDIHRFEERLRDAEKSLGVKESVRVIYDRNPGTAGRIITFLLLGVAIISLLLLRKNMKINISMEGFNQLGRAKFTLIDSANGPGKGVKFDDVAGLKEAKVEVMEFVDYLKRPEHYSNLGAKVPKGALLLGPPGCGKTLLAKAVATESNVPFLSMNGSEFVEMIGGLGAARVRDLFKEAKKRAPCIVYIDELDAVGRARATGPSQFGAAGGESEQTLNQLLVEMDGMASREGIVVLGSTNRADVLDKALLRPGRFDRHILIDLPTLAERQEIFQRHLKNIVIEVLPQNYVKKLAYMTPGFSGADIANVCNEAALHAARHKKTMVAATDLEYAVERVVGGTEKRSHAMSPQEKKIIAYHESGHVLMGWLLEHTDALLKVTIVPRTNLTLGFAQYTTSDQKLYSKEELFDRMCMALGGRAAEAIIFNSITSGARDDLDKVTKIAYAQVRQYGMSPTVGLVHFPDDDRRGKAPYSKTLKHLMDLEAKQLVADAYFRTMNILKENTDKLKLIADTLLKKESLGFKDIQELIGPPKYPKKFIDPSEFEQGLKKLKIEDANEAEMPPDATPTKPNESRT